MAYGLQVHNADGQIILDSSEGLATFIKTTSGAVTPSNDLFTYPSGITTSHLFFARIAGDGFIGEHFYSVTNSSNEDDRQVFTDYSSSVQWLKADKTTGNVSGFADAYGLNVFDDQGVASTNLLFSSNTSTSLDIVAVGTYDSLKTNSWTSKRYLIDSTEPHYVLINGSLYLKYNVPYVGWLTVTNGYEFSYTGSTLDYIDILSKVVLPGWTNVLGGGTSYMIVKERS